ncbi:MAG: hypothetical protein NZ740_06635 [Kiritimatiellae bacterium]|nr:hypothetical protein [Kiritimatiellia bacterium]MDW8458773.1 hypothetical protein [Verrucomicrobiota bacterium]
MRHALTNPQGRSPRPADLSERIFHARTALLPAAALFFLAAAAIAAIPSDLETGQRLVEQLSLADWMGPLAPVALSPFFGLCCLSGAALLAERGWIPAHPLFQGNPALQNETVFFALLALTLFTSLPRLTKVTKPIAQLADFLETYAGIVYMIVVYWAVRAQSPQAESAALTLAAAGPFGDLLIPIAAACNILVIGTLRAFFEMLVWLSPIPLVDAAFEAANKTLCAGLVALYVISPTAALAVNLTLFVLCALFVRAAYRRLRAFRVNVLVPAWRRITGRAPPRGP